MIHRITKILLNQKETGNFIIFEWCIIIKNATHPLTHKHTLDASDGSNLFRVKLCFILKHKLITSSIVPEHQVSTVGRCNVKYHFKLLFNASNDDDRWHQTNKQANEQQKCTDLNVLKEATVRYVQHEPKVAKYSEASLHVRPIRLSPKMKLLNKAKQY